MAQVSRGAAPFLRHPASAGRPTVAAGRTSGPGGHALHRAGALGLALLAVLLAAAILLPPAATGSHKTVRPFLVYYGGPGPESPARPQTLARRLQGYPVVVLGLASAYPAFAAKVVRLMPHTTFYGYADTGHVTFAHVARRLELLHRVGMQGVLLDEIGTGLSASRADLRRIVLLAQRDGLRVMLNAWDPSDVLSLPLRPRTDGVLCENWVYSGGAWVQRDAAVYAALRRLERRHVLVFMIATTKGVPSPAAPPAAGISATARAVFGNYLSLSDPVYSADNDAIFPASTLRRQLRRLAF